MRLTSYIDNTGTPAAIGKMESDTAHGLRTCYERTEQFARQQCDEAPTNTSSNPADRVKRFRESISWNNEDRKDSVLRSSEYKKSAILFLNCILAAAYGENVSLESESLSDLKKEGGYKGRQYFVEQFWEALYGGKDSNGNKGGNDNKESTLPDTVIFIHHNDTLIGLFSPAGPIPAVDANFNFKNLPLDTSIGTKTIIDALTDQDKQIVKFWFDSNSNLVQQCNLYTEILSHIRAVEVDCSIKKTLKIEPLNSNTTAAKTDFPSLREYNGKLFGDTVTLIPLEDVTSPFGFNVPALEIELKPLGELAKLPYAFIPPFSAEALTWTRNDNFRIQSISVDCSTNEERLKSVTVIGEILVNNISVTVTKTYSKDQIRYIKQFPALSIYGPSSQFAWIALRTSSLKTERVSPLDEGNDMLIGSPKDIEFFEILPDGERKLDFTEILEDYYLYCGTIPRWCGIQGNGNWLGGIPLRAASKTLDGNWEEAPAYIHSKIPQAAETLKVAVDMGSSRTIVLFWKSLSNLASIDDVLVAKGQKLAVILTKALGSESDRDATFERIYFQKETSDQDLTKKNPYGVFPTPRLHDAQVLLYKSGKLVQIDPKTVSETQKKDGKDIISDIKTNLEKRNDEMQIYVQGILTKIIDRATHLGCSNIDIRVSYLTEQYTCMKKIWLESKEVLEQNMPDDTRISVNVEMFLPESLAIANSMCHSNSFQSGSGAVFIDIGDLSTDIALFQNKTTGVSDTGTDVELIANCSIRFAGQKILLRAIWDYILFSKRPIDRLFPTASDPNAKKILSELETQRDCSASMQQVRNNLLYLMNFFPKDDLPLELQNLFDIGYLAEVLILKYLLEKQQIPIGNGAFNIHLFGGGSTYFKPETQGFNWTSVLGRLCRTQDESERGDALANGLLREIHANIAEAAQQEKQRGEIYENDASQHKALEVNDVEELKQSYIEFVRSAAHLQAMWRFQNSFGSNQNTFRVFNILDETPHEKVDKKKLLILNMTTWGQKYQSAFDFAKSCAVHDSEMFKILFDYEMAYSLIKSFYQGGRNAKL